MGTVFSEVATTAQNLIADLRTAILASSDWAQPNAAGKPNLLKCTTTRGAQMAIDLADAAITTQRMQLGVYRSHDGTTGVDKQTKQVWWKRVNSGSITDASIPLYLRVSAGKEHLYFDIEGPRPGQTSVDSNTWGSIRQPFFLCDLVPYFTAEDTTPVVVTGSNHYQPNVDLNNGDGYAYSFGPGAGDPWRIGKLGAVQHLYAYGQLNRYGRDGNYYLSPLVMHEDNKGMRGRLNNLFWAGFNYQDSQESPLAPQGATITYGGKQYRILAPYKSDGSNAVNVGGEFGFTANANGNTSHRSPLVAVPVN